MRYIVVKNPHWKHAVIAPTFIFLLKQPVSEGNCIIIFFKIYALSISIFCIAYSVWYNYKKIGDPFALTNFIETWVAALMLSSIIVQDVFLPYNHVFFLVMFTLALITVEVGCCSHCIFDISYSESIKGKISKSKIYLYTTLNFIFILCGYYFSKLGNVDFKMYYFIVLILMFNYLCFLFINVINNNNSLIKIFLYYAIIFCDITTLIALLYTS